MKFIIHNKAKLTDEQALLFVLKVVSKGLISGDPEKGTEQYCYVSTFGFENTEVTVICQRRSLNTMTFKLFRKDKNGII